MTQTNARQYQRRRTAAQWTSENPILGFGEIGVVGGGSQPGFKIGDGVTAWNDLPGPLWVEDIPEITAGDPTELGITVAAGTATFNILDPIARTWTHRVSQYYANYTNALSGNQTMTQDNLRLQTVLLSKGTMDRIGVEVTTAVASLIVRLGVYADDGGLPGALIAEAASTADASTTGVKDLTISATIPENGRYWLASVSQAAAGGALRAPASNVQMIPMPIGTSAPSGSSGYLCRTVTGVTGALPNPVGTLSATASNVAHLVHYRYSNVG